MNKGKVTLQKALANPYSTLVVAYIILFTVFSVGSKNFLTAPTLDFLPLRSIEAVYAERSVTD